MKLQDIIIWILFIISLLVVGWYIFGNSPTIEQALLVLIISFLFVINTKISQMGVKLEISEKKFSALAKDFKEHIKHK